MPRCFHAFRLLLPYVDIFRYADAARFSPFHAAFDAASAATMRYAAGVARLQRQFDAMIRRCHYYYYATRCRHAC